MVELQPAVFLQAIRTSSLIVGLLSTQWPRVGSDPRLLMWKSLGPVLCLLCPLKVMVSFCLFQNLFHKGNEEVNGVYAPTEVLCSAFVGICVSMQIQPMVTFSPVIATQDLTRCVNCRVSGQSVCFVGTGMHSETVMSILAAALQSEVWAACGALPE